LALTVGQNEPLPAQAAQKRPAASSTPNELDPEIEQELSYLLDIVRQPESGFDPARVGALLDAATDPLRNRRPGHPAQRAGGYGVSLRGVIKAPLQRILRYGFDPSIPSFLILPKLLRLSGWYPQSDIVNNGVQIWASLSKNDTPIVLRGRQYEVTTPDTSTGGLVVLLQHDGNPVLVTVSRTARPSEVGKRAVIVDDANWTYFYSEEKGLAPALLKWMDTFIYDSRTVMIFSVNGRNSATTDVVLFKWMNAGWKGINVVKPEHIRAGSQRFIDNLSYVMESENMPDALTLIRKYEQVKSLNDEELDLLIKNYAGNFEKVAASHDILSEEPFSRLIRNSGYARILDREERIGIVMLEFMKDRFGKRRLIDVDLADSGNQESGYRRLARNTAPLPDSR
jgi:hypothetical protein